jgi:Metalloenzyme superfamily
LKNLLTCIILFSALPVTQPGEWENTRLIPALPAENLFVITIDGFRWQEIFNGADPSLISDTTYTPDTATMKMLYWHNDPSERRKKLLPFFWNIVATKGQLYGNRNYNNKVNTANLYRCSYPGYNEIFTGHTDIMVSNNKKKNNGNLNVLEYLDSKQKFKGKVVAFTSWDVFPYILNEERGNLLVNSGYENIAGSISAGQEMINSVQINGVAEKGATRYDQLTFLMAKEYVQKNQPKVVFIGLGETDEYAHQGRYDLYLEQANKIDRMIAELWHLVQTTPGYKDNTSFLITTDHGRGSRDSKWTSHSAFIKGSSQTWLAMIGPGIEPLGEIKEEQQFYQDQFAATIAGLVGEKFKKNTPVVQDISLH